MDLLERGAALDVVVAHGAAAYAGRGGAICVVAPAGVGKTSFLLAARERLAGAGLRVLAATAGEHERSLPHCVTRVLLEPALTGDARDGVLVDAAAPARALLGGAATTGSLSHALYWTLANLAQAGPLALVVDDAHWADEASLETLAYVARRLADLSLLLVVATRPDAQAAWPAPLVGLHRSATELTLAPLSADGTATFLAGAVGENPSPAFATACHEATGGVPFYLDELARDVVRRGLEPVDAQADVVAGIAPTAIVRSVLLRLAALGPAAPQLARAAAVLGDGARLADVAELAALDPDEAAVAADALVAGGILARAGVGFAHPILRAAVLDDIGPHARSRLHARAARILHRRRAAVGPVAAHLLEAEPEADPWVCATLLAAALEAMAAGSPGTAAQLLQRAQQEPPPAEVQAEHLFALGLAEAALGDLAALGHLEASIAGTSEAGVRAERALVIGELARKAGLAPVGIAALDTALAVLDPDSVPGALAAIDRFWIGRTTLPTLDIVRADRPTLDRAFAHPDPVVRRRAAAYLAMEAALDGTRDDVERYLGAALGPPGLVASMDADSGSVAAALIALTVLERHDDLGRVVDDLVADSGRSGNGVAYALASLWRAVDLLRTGRLADADSEALAVIRFATEAGWVGGTPELAAVHVLACLGQGRTDVAAAALASSPFGLDVVEVAPIAFLLEARGQVALAQGRPADALADARRAGDALEAMGLSNPGYVAWRSTAAEATRLLGDLAGARDLAEEQVAVADALSGPAARAAARRVLATTVDREAGLRLLEDARALVDAGPARGEQALVAADLGALLRRSGRTAEAREPLRIALLHATTCGMEPLVRRVREELLAAGGRPRRVELTGPASLTASELRVARMAASGLTNTLIAQTLFVSRKTVEAHLARAYAKLGVASRADLVSIDLDSA